MTSQISTVAANYVTLLETVSSLQTANGGLVFSVADPTPVLKFETISAPAGILVFDGEQAGKDMAIGGTVQRTDMAWSVFLLAASFDTRGQGVEGDTGIYQLIDDVLTAVNGRVVDMNPVARAFYVSCRRFEVLQNVVVYQMRFRNQFIRHGFQAST